MPEKPEVKVAEIVPAEETVDEKLVEEAAKHIQKVLGETVARGVLEVGKYVFERFFDGDIGKVTSKDPTKNVSLSALAKKCGTPEVPISKTWLYNALGVAVATKELGPKSPFALLPPSHQTTLLPLRYHDDFEKVAKVAERAVAKKMTVKKLRSEVEKELEKIPKDESKGGRPPTPLIVKTLDRSLKNFSFEEGKRGFTEADVKELSDEQIKDALESAEKLAKKVDGLIERLKKKA